MPAPTPQKGPGPERFVPRHYRYNEVAWVLVAFVLCGLLFDSGGLLTWANRLKFGPGQTFWLRLLTPLHAQLERAGLDRPRQALIAASDQLSARYAPGVDEVVAPADDGALATGSPAALEPAGPLAGLELPLADEVELGAIPDPDPRTSGSSLDGGAGVVTLLLVGDSMMQVGLAPAIASAFAEEPRVRILKETHPGTGLSRPDVLDWPARLAPLLATNRPRYVVASFGGNDAQDLRQAGAVIPFGTSTWDQAYLDRVHGFMEELTHDGAEVLWVGLPPMRSPDFSERVAKLNDLDLAAAKGVPHVEFLDPAPAVTGPDRAYVTYLPRPAGGLVQVRQEDGIHLTSAGGERVAVSAVAWIHAHALTVSASALSGSGRAEPAPDRKPGG
jgi:lysophospholipase L1-like esterase